MTTMIWSFAILCAIYFFGQWVGRKTKGYFTGALVCALILLIGFWTNILPKDIVATANVAPIQKIMAAIIITNVGASFEPRLFKQYWKVALTALAACAGLTVLVVGIGMPIVGRQLSLAAFPTLLGGMQATLLLVNSLTEKGLGALAAIVLLVNGTQGFIGMPMVAFGSRKYSSKLMQDYRNGNRLESKMPKDKGPKRVPWIDRVATPQNNLFLQLTTLSLVSAIGNSLAEYTAAATNGVVGMALVCLTLGMICRQVGLLSHNPLQKSGIFAFMMFTTVMGMNASLANLSPMELLHNIGPIILLLVLGGIGLLVAGVVVGKVFKLDVGLSIAVAFGAFTGYPINYQIALEALQSTTDDPEERSYLEEHILTQVSLGSIVSVTVTSVIAAGVVIALL